MNEEENSSLEDIKNSITFFQFKVKINSLSKHFLYILEDLQQEFDIPDDKFARCRKRILDISNDIIREEEGKIKVKIR